MTKSELFKAAHKLAKAFKAISGGYGDYIVYLQRALKSIIAASKASNAKDSIIFKMINNTVRTAELCCFITHSVKKHATHGQKVFDSMYKLEKARKELKIGQFFGQVSKSNGQVKAWVKSATTEQVAY